jgi:hypothetical protein
MGVEWRGLGSSISLNITGAEVQSAGHVRGTVQSVSKLRPSWFLTSKT